MIRTTVVCLSLVVSGQAHAAAQEPAQAAAPPIATGTPTDATATVSPATVAGAASRPDATDAGRTVFELSLGSSLASGDFGTGQSARIISTALGARLALGTFRISASIPYLSVRGRGLIFSGVDSTPVIAAASVPGARTVTHDGLGDLTLGAAYTLREQGDLPEIELAGRVKLPTASSASQLSTGKADGSFGIQITKAFGHVAPFVSATYRVFGNPSSIRLEDGFAASGGASFSIGRAAVLLASYHYAAAASRLVRDAHELFAGLSVALPRSRLRLTGFATAGLSSGAAAESGGLSLSLAVR